LLDSARDDAPPQASVQRAHQLVDTASAAQPAARKRRLLWVLPAAALALGIVLVVLVKPSRDDQRAVPVAAPSLRPDSAAQATASAFEVAQPLPAATATPSASSSAQVASKVVAQRDRPRPAGTKSKPNAAKPNAAKPIPPKSTQPKSTQPKSIQPKPTGACGCKPADLMCQMRCSQKPQK